MSSSIPIPLSHSNNVPHNEQNMAASYGSTTSSSSTATSSSLIDELDDDQLHPVSSSLKHYEDIEDNWMDEIENELKELRHLRRPLGLHGLHFCVNNTDTCYELTGKISREHKHHLELDVGT